MALRSLLNKMPALSSSPMGHALNGLSPAAGSRLMSRAAPIDKLEKAMQTYRRELALSRASIEETMRLYEQDHRSMMKEFDRIDKASNVLLIACPLAMGLVIINHVVQ